jgi:hypothetical protein
MHAIAIAAQRIVAASVSYIWIVAADAAGLLVKVA